MEFINEGSTLPSPFNLIPTPKGIYNFFHTKICNQKNQKSAITINGSDKRFSKNDTESAAVLKLKPNKIKVANKFKTITSFFRFDKKTDDQFRNVS
jgi:hypothetical protein